MRIYRDEVQVINDFGNLLEINFKRINLKIINICFGREFACLSRTQNGRNLHEYAVANFLIIYPFLFHCANKGIKKEKSCNKENLYSATDLAIAKHDWI